MNNDLLKFYRRQLEPLAERMEKDSMACSSAAIRLEGEEYEVPALVVKGPSGAVLERPVVRCQVLGIETSECPVVAIGLEFPLQAETLTGWYWSWLPMHTAEQRALLELMASAPGWLVVVFSGEEVSRAMIVRANDIARARYRQLKQVVDSYPTNPRADTQRALDAAQSATADALGNGFILETVSDLGSGDPGADE